MSKAKIEKTHASESVEKKATGGHEKEPSANAGRVTIDQYREALRKEVILSQ